MLICFGAFWGMNIHNYSLLFVFRPWLSIELAAPPKPQVISAASCRPRLEHGAKKTHGRVTMCIFYAAQTSERDCRWCLGEQNGFSLVVIGQA